MKFRELAVDAMRNYRQSGGQDCRNFEGRMTTIVEKFGDRVAASILPEDILVWLPIPNMAGRQARGIATAMFSAKRTK